MAADECAAPDAVSLPPLKPVRRAYDDPAFTGLGLAERRALHHGIGAHLHPPGLSFAEIDAYEAALVGAAEARLGHWRRLRAVWQATWKPAMETVIFVEPLNLGEHDGCLGDGEFYAPSADLAWRSGWTGWGYRWNDGVVLTGVRLDDGEHLGLVVHAVDRRNKAVSRLDEIGDGWARDAEGWLAFPTGIQETASPAELEPLRAAAMNMAAHISWLSR